uniref:Uncharacterized protein n=1 Tax=Cucumis melo TaxID=3656 RepID=A0A9I9EMQ7_CUCME
SEGVVLHSSVPVQAVIGNFGKGIYLPLDLLRAINEPLAFPAMVAPMGLASAVGLLGCVYQALKPSPPKMWIRKWPSSDFT